MPSLGDFQDDSTVVRANIANQKSDLGALRTSASASDEPKLAMTTYGLSDAMQGMALYKPPGITYDVFNRDLSQEMQDMGVEPLFTQRQDKLTPYDIFVKDPDASQAGNLGTNAQNGSNAAGSAGAGQGSPDPYASGDADNIKFMNLCLAQIGDQYGPTTPNPADPNPNLFDCSSLVQWALARLGITFPRTTFLQWPELVAKGLTMTPAKAAMTKGALLYVDNLAHVAISLGTGDQSVEATNPRMGVTKLNIAGRENGGFTKCGYAPGLKYV